jgi:hypothetical protein
LATTNPLPARNTMMSLPRGAGWSKWTALQP